MGLPAVVGGLGLATGSTTLLGVLGPDDEFVGLADLLLPSTLLDAAAVLMMVGVPADDFHLPDPAGAAVGALLLMLMTGVAALCPLRLSVDAAGAATRC